MGHSQVKIHASSFHRNGISGQPFHTVTLTVEAHGIKHDLLAVVFETPGHIAILDRGGASDSWRPEKLEKQIREFLLERESDSI